MTDGYCTDCEQETTIGPDGRGLCGHGRVIRLKEEYILKSIYDRDIAAAEAAMAEGIINEAVGMADGRDEAEYIERRLRALITDRSALDQVIAEAVKEGMRKARKAVSELPEDAQKVWALEAITVAMLRENDAAIRGRGE